MLSAPVLAALAACQIGLAPSSDYRYLVASLPDGAAPSPYRWLRNGQPLREIAPRQTFLLHVDDALLPVEGPQPLVNRAVTLVDGQWGKALYLGSGGQLAYPRDPLLPLEEATIEMWIAAREDGSSETYTRDNELFRHSGPGGDYLRIAQAGRDGTLYLGGSVRGQWQSAYGTRASMRSWKPGVWHHIAATYSASENSMRFYLDGVRTADTNERQYWPPAAGGDRFTIGSDAFLIDEVRISSRSFTIEEVRASTLRTAPPAHGEVWLPLADISAGDSITVEAASCASAEFLYRGIPITEVSPASTLLPPGTGELPLTVRTSTPASCRFSLNAAPPFNAMAAFDEGAGSTEHRVILTGLSADPNTVNEVHIRCDNGPGYSQKLLYRALGRVNPPYPRIGNLWGSGNMLRKGHEYAARISGYFGAEMSPADIHRLRELNPEILILTSINTVENHGLPDDYYLKDTRGNKIEVWPGTYRLNLTKPYVAEYQARFAWQKLLDSGMLYDGVFFDNFFTSQAWLRADIHGTPVQLDADEDGRPDDPRWLDAEWRKGVFSELAIWRSLMPHALASGHLPRPVPPDVGEIFNGDSVLFVSTNVIDGKASFSDLWDMYHRWWELGRPPVITAIESSPPNQISYGYGYNILRDTPLPTQEFARTSYRYMRFGLATALMNDGYFWYDFGDIHHGIDWPFDEYSFDLGYPEGPAQLYAKEAAPGANLLQNGDFEEPLSDSWNLTISGSNGAAAALARDSDAAEGRYSALVTITNAGSGTEWHVDFNQRDRRLTKGVAYEMKFWAKAGEPREIRLGSQKGAPDWRNYGLSRTVSITTEWKEYKAVFDANETATDSRIQFFLGARTGKVWLDGVRLYEQPDQIYQRFFTKGMVLLNGASKRVTVAVPPGYSRFAGSEAPRHQYVIDDDAPGFRMESSWQEVIYDTGQWKSRGPYYHNWGKSCRKSSGTASAQWDLGVLEDGIYTIEAWWAAAPEQSTWSRKAVYEIVAGDRVLAVATLDQTQSGDQWRRIAEVELRASDKPFVRLRSGDGPAIADALYVWSAARYNDGSPASELTLEPYDAILLKK